MNSRYRDHMSSLNEARRTLAEQRKSAQYWELFNDVWRSVVEGDLDVLTDLGGKSVGQVPFHYSRSKRTDAVHVFLDVHLKDQCNEEHDVEQETDEQEFEEQKDQYYDELAKAAAVQETGDQSE